MGRDEKGKVHIELGLKIKREKGGVDAMQCVHIYIYIYYCIIFMCGL